jgi:hypothetical protein
LAGTDVGAVPGPETPPAPVKGVVVEGGGGKPGPPVKMLFGGGWEGPPEGPMDGLKCSKRYEITIRKLLKY